MGSMTQWEEIAAEVTSALGQAASSSENSTPRWSPWRVLASLDRRSEKRFPLVYPVRVHGFDCGNNYFSERTFTLDISENGCRLVLHTAVQPGSVLAVTVAPSQACAPPSEKALFEVMWVNRRGEGWEVGARRLDRKNIWGVTFPISVANG